MGANFPSLDKDLLEGLVKMYRDLEERIKESDGLVRKLYTELREAQFISTVFGFHLRSEIFDFFPSPLFYQDSMGNRGFFYPPFTKLNVLFEYSGF